MMVKEYDGPRCLAFMNHDFVSYHFMKIKIESFKDLEVEKNYLISIFFLFC